LLTPHVLVRLADHLALKLRESRVVASA